MPKPNLNQGQPFEEILEAITKNSENQKKILNSLMLLQHFLENRLSHIADAVESKNETNNERTIAEIQTLQTDVKALLIQVKKMENAPNSMLTPTQAL
jgi:seryl-tRNA synthetase